MISQFSGPYSAVGPAVRPAKFEILLLASSFPDFDAIFVALEPSAWLQLVSFPTPLITSEIN